MIKKIRGIRIEGNMAFVPLTQGYEAVIDADDVPIVSSWNWYALTRSNTVYAVRNLPNNKGIISMHRALLGFPVGMEVDHRDRNGLNNTRRGESGNLRVASHAENMRNQGLRADSTTGFKGVSLHKPTGRYHAYIWVDGKRKSLRYHDTAEQAHKAYSAASLDLHGAFGRNA
jgi:hypothetical protein